MTLCGAACPWGWTACVSARDRGDPTIHPAQDPYLPLHPTVYKTKLLKMELSDDFDEYIMTIEQVIKSGQQGAPHRSPAPNSPGAVAQGPSVSIPHRRLR